MIKQDKNLYRGIFWITDIDDIYSSDLYFRIPCDKNGDINDADFKISPLTASMGADNYNHEKFWNYLDKKATNGKPFDYYPRGRVQIKNGTAIIYHSPHIPQAELRDWCADKFNLAFSNGIKKIMLIADGSKHYRCWLDD